MRAFCFFFSLLLIPVSIAMAILSLFGVLASYISPVNFVLPAFINLFLPVLLLTNQIGRAHV